MSIKNILLGFLLFGSLTAKAQIGVIVGSTNVEQGNQITYSFQYDSDIWSAQWEAPNGQILWTNSNPSSYYYEATIYWPSSGTGTVRFKDSGVLLDQKSITIRPQPPIASPSSSITASSFVASWGAITTVTGYQLDVSTSSSFGSFVSGYNSLAVASTSQTVSGLSAGTTYYYRVRGVNGSLVSNNSGTVTTLTLPAAPSSANATSITTTSFTANWGAVTSATSYRLDVSTVSNFSSFVSGYNNLTVASVSQSVSGLSPGTTYYYRARAVNATGASANSSTTTTLTLPSAPSVGSGSGMTTTSFTANWSSVTSATSYALDVSTESNFASFVSGYNNLSVGSTSQSVTGLSAGTTYYYRVRAVNVSGTSSNSSIATVLTVPSNPSAGSAGSISANSFTANWSGTASATSYRLDVSAASDFSSFVSGYNDLTVGSTSQSVTGLSAGTTYYYRARAVNGSGTSSNSNTMPTLTLPVAPSANAGASITTTSFTASWNSVTSATNYRLDVSTVSNFASFVSGFNDLSVGSTSQSVTGLSAGTTYYYRVRAVNGSGASANSNAPSVLTLPSAPTANAGSSITSGSFTASWNSVTSATGYRLDVSLSNSFTSFVTGYNDLFVASTSQSVTGLSAGTTYYYRVRAVNGSGTSANSGTMAVLTLPPAPTANPATSITTSSFTANWISATSATGYRLDVSTASDFSSFVSGYNNLTIGAITSQSVTGLSAGTTYYYRVRAVNGTGTSANSGTVTVLTLPSAPTASNASSITTTSLTASWNSVTSATDYRLDVSTVSDFSSFVLGYNNLTVGTTSQSVTGLSAGITYYYRVRAVNGSGNSANSNTISAITISAAPVTTPPSALAATSFTANWNSSTGAASYRVDVSTASDFSSFVTGYNDLPVSSGTTQSVTGLSSGVTYYYRVRAVNASGTSANSNVTGALTLPSTPNAAAATSVTATSFTANWGSVASAVSYRLDVSTTTDFSVFVSGYNNLTVSSTSQNVSGLAGGVTYYYRVRAENASGTSANSGTIPVLTLPAAPSATAASSVTISSFTANWSSVTSAGYKLDVSSSSDFSSFIAGYNDLSVASTSQGVTGLSAGTTYYYRVRAVNATGASANSNVINVITITVAPTATASSAITSESFTANWSTVTGAASYQLDVSTNSNFSTFVSGYNSLSVSGGSKNVTGLAEKTTYYYRVRGVNPSGASVSSNVIFAVDLDRNYILSNDVLTEGVTTEAQVNGLPVGSKLSKYGFIDDLGRPEQAVLKQQSPNGQDMVQPVVYDEYGRETVKYLPYISGNDGWLKLDFVGKDNASYGTSPHAQFYQNASKSAHDNAPYAVTVLEPSPLSRPVQLGATGAAWQPDLSSSYNNPTANDHSIKKDYSFNSANEVLFFRYVSPNADNTLGFTGFDAGQYYYPANTLFKNKTKDEDNNEVIEFTDKSGQVLLKKVQISVTEYAQTYYVYDDTGDLVTVFQPEATKSILTKVQATTPTITWTGALGISVGTGANLNNLTKTATSGYGNAGMISTEVLQAGQDGWVETTAAETDKSRMIGFDSVNVNTNVNIKFAVELRNDGNVYAWEKGVSKEMLGAYVSGTVVRLARESGLIKYYINGALKRTSSILSTTNLIVDVAADHNGATLKSVKTSFACNATIITSLNNFAFRYTYDHRKRMTQKLVPGSGIVYMVYDNRDRLVLTQDAVQRATSPKYWTFTKYDELNRPIITGIKDTTAALTQAQMQQAVDNHYNKSWAKFGESYVGSITGNIHGYSNKSYPVIVNSTSTIDQYRCLTVTYYDNYAFRSLWQGSFTYLDEDLNETANAVMYTQPETESNSVTGLVTGTKIKVLDGTVAGGYTWLRSINYYDDKNRVVQTLGENYKGGTDRTTNVFDFTGKVLTSKTTHIEKDVKWKDQVGILVSGNKLTRTSGALAGAVSVEQLQAGQDGYLEFEIGNVVSTNYFHVGFNDSNPDVDYTNIDYAVTINNGNFQVIENNVVRINEVNVLKSADVIRIERTGTTVKYYKNSLLKHTSTVASSGALMVDICFRTTNGTLTGLRTSFSTTTTSITRRFGYDHAGRLTKTWHKINSNSEVLLNSNTYNELGQLVDKKLHSTIANASDAKQSLDYRYNIRGWLNKVNESDLSADDAGDPRDYFGFELGYNSSIGIGNAQLFNGNISGMKWSSNLGLSDVKMNGYSYQYDKLNRLSSATLFEGSENTGIISWAIPSGNAFSESGLTYDYNGNIMTLNRKGKAGSNMDALAYNYGGTPSNRLQNIVDAGDKNKGFTDSGTAATTDYVYDANGNMIWDRNKGGKELLINGEFTNGSSDWTVSDTESRFTFTNDELSVSAGTISSTITQTPLIPGKQYVVILDVVRGAGTILISTGTGNATISTTGVHVFTLTAGASANYITVTATSTFAGTIKSASVKGITIITYNVLNLPEFVSRVNDKDIQYIYDATGRKLSQDLRKNNIAEKKTDYMGEFFYENDTLKFINHEEGRVVMTGASPEYQYNLKDHLGNVRMTFTTKNETENATATLEDANLVNEQNKFLRIQHAKRVQSTLFNHTNGGGNGYAERLNGSTNEKYGIAKSLSVMPGDTVKMEVYAKYVDTNSANWTQALTDLVSAIGANSAGVVVDGGGYGTSTSSFSYAGLLNTSGSTGNGPKAYLNWLIFDRDYNFINGGYQRMTDAAKEQGQDVAHEKLMGSFVATQPGYVYIYLSNEETTPVEVFFDDFKVEHVKSAVVQMDDYYPFGLEFNSYSRENSVDQNFKYNGKEVQDELDLGWIDYGARMYMPEIGRWGVVDPLASKYPKYSPYNYALNNPIYFIDPDGMAPEPCKSRAIGLKDYMAALRAAGINTLSRLHNYHGGGGHYIAHAGAPGRYLYSEKWGWADMRHVASIAEQTDFPHKTARGALEEGERKESNQLWSLSPSDKASAYDYEDLTSNLLGVGLESFLESEDAEGKDFLTNVETYLTELGFVDDPTTAPNYEDLEEDNNTDTGEQNFTYYPSHTRSALFNKLDRQIQKQLRDFIGKQDNRGFDRRRKEDKQKMEEDKKKKKSSSN